MVKKFFKSKRNVLLVLLAIVIPITSIALTYGVLRDKDAETVSKGVVGDTVYVDDYDSDYYYYTGQNYTSGSTSLPTTADKGYYDSSSLVKVTVTYSGTDYKGKNTGYVSLDEKQSKYVYYKYFPVENGYINIDLIDNPFSNHPDDLMFNGWTTNYKGASISLDNTYYERSAKVPVTYSNGKPSEIKITFYASWTTGKVAYVSSNFNNASSSLDSVGMNKVSTVKYIYDISLEGYYTSETLTTTTVVSGRGWNQTRNTTYGTCTDCYDSYNDYYDSYQCPAPSNTWGTGTFTNTCTVYHKLTSDAVYDSSETYYTYSGYSYSQVTLNPTIIGTEENGNFDSNTNMSGYFRKTTVDFNTSLDGYYDSSGNSVSGTCWTWDGCEEYELIQFYKDDGTEELLDKDTTYYYLTTRDTNIVVMTGSMSSTWGSSFTKPFTLTGIYNGKNYNPTWTVSNTAVTAYTTLSIENLTINSRSNSSNYNPPTSSGTSGVFYGNYNNVKIGRGIKKSGNYVNFRAIVGGYSSSSGYGSSTVGSSSSPKKYKIMVESGYYSSATSALGAQTGTSGTSLYTEMYMVYGNDYDRATENNSNLDLYYCASGSWSGQIHSSNDTSVAALNTIVKSGSFGSGKYDYSTGIYVGGRYGGTQYAPKTIKVEGGYIYNLIGGPVTSSNLSGYNAVYIYMTGGSVDVITGGAGRSETYGNRIVQVTGGKVNYGVSGGSNGYTGSSSEGVLTGSTYVYIGGVATIGDDDLISSDSDLYGISSGTVFGAGNGNSTYASIGSVNNTYIVINDEANIKGNVYGSGNYGTVGYNSGGTVTTEIDILGGTVKNVFGSGNNSGSGKQYSTTMAVTINMTGGVVTDGIYGGSNASGTLYGNVNLNITGGTANNVFGGGLGSNTYVERNVVVNLGGTTKVTGSAYGGSAYGTVNGISKSTSKSSYTTLVNVDGGDINNVFGGGKGDDSNTPYVLGDVTLTINDGKVTNAFGGNDASGEPNGTVSVYLKGGEVTSAYGGGNKTAVTNTYVYQEGSTTGNLFGGSNESGDVTSSNITVTGGTVNNLYGGNNVGGKTSTTNIDMSSGTVTTMYGGGKLTNTGVSNISVSSGNVTTIYGGGEEASIDDDTNIDITGGTIDSVYGGSNVKGDVPISNVDINGGTINSVYGGNNQGGLTTTSNVNLNSGNITTVYGGGNQAEVTTSNIKFNGSSVNSIYGGGNQAGVTTTNVNLITGTCENVFGGSNTSGTVKTSNVISSNPSGLNVDAIYGGNNQGGLTNKAYVTLNGGTYNNIYGGGNFTVTDYTYVDVNNITMTGKFYGGGNQAGINYSTDVKFKNSSIAGDLFGGGNLGTVDGSTTVYISNSTINSSAYAGGNGSTATVYGNTTLTIDGTTTIDKHVFGGGNAANTGDEDSNSSISTVNIAGATIHGNVYGGANTAKLFGKVLLNIGSNVDDYTKADIQIDGTVFGGGEANASGSENYDYSFISVTTGITINIDGEDYNNFNIDGSIFGSGNASSTEGYSYINISNYGTFDDYKENISIQRADRVIIKNSAIMLEGTTDRTNEYSKVQFTLSRIGELKLANNSTLFLQTGTNLLQKFSSVKISGGNEEKAKVTISGDSVTKNVNNRVYMLEGKNMNVATNEAVTSYGKVSGMTFFGMFQLDRNGKALTAFYDNKYDAGDSVASGEFYTFTSGSYVLGAHNSNHNIEVDGFYSNYENEDKVGTVEVKYIEPTPSDAEYYMWVIGEQVTTYDVSLTASKYSTLGTYELPLTASSGANMTFQIIGFNYQNLEDGFTLVDPSKISRVNTSNKADDVMALSLESSNTGFVTKGQTSFLTDENTPISGTTDYNTENSTIVPSFLLYLYHSKNLTKDREMGTVVISLLAIKPIDDLNNEVTRININVTLSSALYDDDAYEGAMTAGEEYDLFASTTTNITTKSTLSTYYSLYMETNKQYYKDGYYHALVSNYVLPVNTKITMIDLMSNTYYYYVISEGDVTSCQSEYDKYGECSYKLSNFVAMGSTSSNNNFDESKNNDKYFKKSYLNEEFIFNVSFEDTDISGDHTGNTLLMELRNQNDQTLIGVLGIQHANLTYGLYDNESATIETAATLSETNVYLGDSPTLSLTQNFTQPIVNSLPLTDTTYFDKKLGVKLSIYDSNGTKLNYSSLFGLIYEFNGKKYYPRMDGSVRIALADKVANLFSKIKIDTSNLNLSSGTYTLKVESFGSSDGVYYGPEASSSVSLTFNIVDSVYGLKATLPDDEVIIDKKTGLTDKESNLLEFDMGYSSSLANPNIRVTMYRRKYDEIYENNYEKVNILDFVSNTLELINDNQYMFIDDPNSGDKKTLYLKSSLQSGTYKFVFELYDGDAYIGDDEVYIIIK